MTTLLIILLATMLIQGSTIAGQATTAKAARGVLADELRSASFTIISLTAASLFGFAIAHAVLQPLQLDYLRTPAVLCGSALIFLGARALLGRIPSAVRWPDVLAHLTTQSAMLGLALFSATSLETLGEALLYGVGAALVLAMLSASFMALRDRIDAANVPMIFRGIPIALITAGFMALALLGFVGMVRS